MATSQSKAIISRLCSCQRIAPSALLSSRALRKPHASHSVIRSAPAYRSYGRGSNPTPGQSPFKVWPFIAVTLLGTGAYIMMVNSRVDTSNSQPVGTTAPAFSPADVTVIFVLGGPGAGKGTQCANLVRDYNFIHLSAGDLLRAEQEREGSEYGDLIRQHIKDGLIVPMQVTIQLLQNAMMQSIKASPGGKGKFLIDGFPRKMDQAIRFEEMVCPSKFVLFFDCPEEEMQRRLLERGKTSGRSDDNVETIKKRFTTFVQTSMPVVKYFEAQDRVIKISATMSPDEVYKETRTKLEQRLGSGF
ncbi:hypothetical protein K3495_g4433 [Podosphaera aphanis]|nr:hypothetical protein K3495_g4433 [Podosphaera aphanis]